MPLAGAAEPVPQTVRSEASWEELTLGSKTAVGARRIDPWIPSWLTYREVWLARRRR